MRRLILLSVCALCVSLVSSTVAAAGGIRNGRNAIGDSVMLGAKEELRREGFRVNVERSRQFDDAVGIVRNMRNAGTLRRKLVVHLGTNGILVEPGDCNAVARAAGPQRKVFLVTNTGPSPGLRRSQNRRLVACARRHANTSVLGWFAHSRGHGSWFYDGMHLTPSGQRAYARFLDQGTS
jgi:hypothetical protein